MVRVFRLLAMMLARRIGRGRNRVLGQTSTVRVGCRRRGAGSRVWRHGGPAVSKYLKVAAELHKLTLGLCLLLFIWSIH